MQAVAVLAPGSLPARIGVMKALNRHVERVFNPERKDTHWGNGNSREISDCPLPDNSASLPAITGLDMAQDEAAGWSSGLKAKELRCLTTDKRRERGRQGCRR